MNILPPTVAELLKTPDEEILVNGKMLPFFGVSIANTDLIASLDFPSISLPITFQESSYHQGQPLPGLVNLEICTPRG